MCADPLDAIRAAAAREALQDVGRRLERFAVNFAADEARHRHHASTAATLGAVTVAAMAEAEARGARLAVEAIAAGLFDGIAAGTDDGPPSDAQADDAR